jgi:AraC-like DNA-binding protein
VGLWTGWDRLTPVLRYANFYDAVPGGGFGPRFIQDFQILMIQSGAGQGRVDQETFEIAGGDLIYYGPNVLHAVTSSRHAPLKLIGLHFVLDQDDLRRIAFVDEFGSPRPYEYPTGLPRNPLSPAPPAKCSPGVASGAGKVCESLVLSYLMDPAGRMLEKRGLLLTLFELWHDAISHEQTHDHLPAPHREAVDRAQHMILQNLSNPPTTATLCREIRLSERYFARLFKRRTGMSVKQFVLHHRMLWARRLLVEGKLNVSEVAYVVGFADPHYFSRYFARQFGIPPSLVRSERQLA